MKLSSFTIILLFILLFIIGAALSPLLPFRLKPSDTLPSITVSYSWSGADARVIEQEVTSVLEGVFSRIRGVRKTSSVSATGRGNITIEIDKSADQDAVRFELASVIRQVYPTLPEKVSYPQLSVRRVEKESSRPFISYTLNAPSSPYNIQKYAEEKIQPLISSVKGVEEVNISGASPMEWIMLYDAEQLKSLRMNAADIQNAINQYLRREAAGQGYEPGEKKDTAVLNLTIRNFLANDTDFLKIPVKKVANRVIHLKDLVTIRHREQARSSYYRINGANTINILVYAGETENQIRLSKEIRTKISEIEKDLPSGYFLLLSYDTTEFIRHELVKNILRALLTVTILLLFVFIVTRSWRYLLIIALSLIANLSIAVIFYYLLKMEMHLYTLAGITVSLSLIKNNSIVMIDHLRHQKNLKVFMAVLAATLTAIAALVVAFFLNDQLRLSLLDFSIIVIINLAVSLFVALFFIPAIMQKIPFKESNNSTSSLRFQRKNKRRKFRLSLYFIRIYQRIILFVCRFRWAFIIVMILGFGLPIYMLPDKVAGETWMANLYNKTLGSDIYKEKIKPVSDKVLGGSLRLFSKDVFENSFYGEVEKTTLFVNAQMDYGSTLEQMNELVISIENYLKQFPDIAQFQSSVSIGQASIVVYFKKEAENTGFPFQLKEMVTQKAIDLGGADWNVQGVGEGFNNSVRETVGQNRITLYGYNYDELYTLAESVKDNLLKNPRARDVVIMSRNAWARDLSFEYVMNLDRERLISHGISPASMVNSLQDYSISDNSIASVLYNGSSEQIKLKSRQSYEIDLWEISQKINPIGKKMVRLSEVSAIKKENASPDIVKENQQYRLILAYDYIGLNEMSGMYQREVIEKLRPSLPLGYTIQGDSNRNSWDKKSKQQYWWLVLIIVIIFFICSILFESLLLPLAVILMIPISYIGVFLTFPLFNLNFDQGGFAAMILLSGITVNSALYIINDFNNLKRTNKKRNPVKLYLKAYNQKIFPILLTVFSTTCGLIPFLSGAPKEVFWPALAAGTIGGLIFSLIGVLFFLPLVLIRKNSFVHSSHNS